MKKLITSLIIPFALSGVSHAIVTNGTGGGNWTDTATWDGGTVPTTGRADVTGGDTVTLNADSSVGGVLVGFIPETGDATFNIDNNLTIGAAAVFNGTSFWLGAASRNGFVVQADNKTVSVGGKITIGGDNDGTYTMGAGAILNADFGLWMGNNTLSGTGGNGILTINGGTVNVGTANGVVMGGTGNFGGSDTGATININSGSLLSTQQIAKPTFGSGAGTAARINIDGGTLQSSASNATFMEGLNTFNILSGGATIDTQAFDISIGQGLLEDASSTGGGLTKVGSGALTLTGASTYTGATTISSGTLSLIGSLSSDVSIADGVVVSGSGSTSGDLTLGQTTGSSLALDLGTATGISVVDLTLNGVTALSTDTIASVVPTTYAIATYSGSLTDSNSGTLLDSFSIEPGSVLVSVTDNAGTIEAVIQLDAVGWTGATSGNWEVGGPDANWTSGDTFFDDGDSIAFDDTGSNKTISLLEDVSPDGLLVNNSAGNDYTFQGGFAIAGATGLTKDGTGVLTLLNANTYTGATLIDGGTLQLGDGNTTGSLAVATVITNNGDLTINRSDSITQSVAISSSAISGTGSLTKIGAGNLTIDRANTYSGDTIISGGTLTFTGAGTSNADGAIHVQNGGTLSLARNDAWGNAGTTNTADITIDAGGVVQSADKYSTIVDLTFNGGTLSANDGVTALFPTFALRDTVTVNATAGGSFISTTGVGDFNTVAIYTTTFDVADGAAASDLTVSVPLSRSGAQPGGGSITKTGAGTMTLSATNTYTGGTTVNAGTLELAAGDQAAPITVKDGASLGFVLGSSIVSTNSVNFVIGSTVTISGAPTLASYTLMTGSAITGTAVLASPIAGYELNQTATILTLDQVAASSPFETWTASKGLTLGVNDGPTDDPDVDGSNLYEYFFWDSDPTVAEVFGSELTGVDGSGALSGDLTFVHDRPQDLTGVVVTYQWTSDLSAGWTNDGDSDGANIVNFTTGTTGASANGNDTDYESVSVEASVSGVGPYPAQIFVRVSVAAAP